MLPDITEGKIVPVEITVELLLNAMRKSASNHFLVDGFPRSIDNYEVPALSPATTPLPPPSPHTCSRSPRLAQCLWLSAQVS